MESFINYTCTGVHGKIDLYLDRERDRETGRQGDRETETERKTEADRETLRDSESQREAIKVQQGASKFKFYNFPPPTNKSFPIKTNI